MFESRYAADRQYSDFHFSPNALKSENRLRNSHPVLHLFRQWPDAGDEKGTSSYFYHF